jgi:CrcB protein
MARDHPLVRIETLALVGIGGFAGANLRFFLAGLTPGLAGTLLANALGSFALGFVLYEAINTDLIASESRTVVSTGFLSSFTTYSTFALQTAGASLPWMAANVLANYGLGFGGVLLGRRLALAVGPVSAGPTGADGASGDAPRTPPSTATADGGVDESPARDDATAGGRNESW